MAVPPRRPRRPALHPCRGEKSFAPTPRPQPVILRSLRRKNLKCRTGCRRWISDSSLRSELYVLANSLTNRYSLVPAAISFPPSRKVLPMFIDNLLPVSPVCTKLDLSPLRRGRFRGGHNLAPTTDTCPLPSLPGSPYHGCRSGPCHIAGPNQDQPLRPVTCRDQTPPQPRILQPFPLLPMPQNGTEWYHSGLSSRRSSPESSNPPHLLPMPQNGTEWYRIRKFRPFLPPLQPRILQPSLTCCRRPKMERNGTEWYRIRKFRPFLPPAASSAHHRRCSHPGSSRTLLRHRTRRSLPLAPRQPLPPRTGPPPPEHSRPRPL